MEPSNYNLWPSTHLQMHAVMVVIGILPNMEFFTKLREIGNFDIIGLIEVDIYCQGFEGWMMNISYEYELVLNKLINRVSLCSKNQ